MTQSTAPFDPDAFFDKWNEEDFIPSEKNGLTFRQSIIKAFNLLENDDYVYHAHGATNLEMTQRAIDAGRANGLHAWYHDADGKPLNPPHPTPAEINAYNTLFSPQPSPLKALTSLSSSSPPNTLRSLISFHLLTPSHTHNPYPNLSLLPPHSSTRTHINPGLSYFLHSNTTLEWAGPTPFTTHTKSSHHMLPILYHHFGCTPPTYASLYCLAKLAQPRRPSKEPVRPILDIGSGNGYWSYMLRRFPLPEKQNWKELEVHAVDNATSEYRVSWVKDTIRSDAVRFLKHGSVGGWKVDGGKGCILLLVYPQATGGFTEETVRAFEGDTVVIVGTACENGFTGFRDVRVDVWFEKNMKGWECVLKMPMPSFAGKDEGFFVFRKKD
ncbi:hypothetical protein M011DRAFT_488973 [Sporormia fimetaria CBS 119925]|uniref:S-adenosyl-L-methionine-dependent methyltransferase n=1 Tax=Sporormia fimetaria CBS 119925 TaxID=1340428 RepID=A0A6A6V1P0_9PLEO|nr:hypothetical protein M011DRAFT_488973 [Sporormia fimetaria CBS 119925]